MRYGDFRPIKVDCLWTDHFERKCWEMHDSGKSVRTIARELDYPEYMVKDAIVGIWYKERRPYDFGRKDG